MTALSPGGRGPAGAVMRILGILVFGVTIGSIAAFLTDGFIDAINWLNNRLYITFHSRQALSVDAPIRGWLFLVPALGGLVVGLLVLLTSDRRPHNPADVIEAVHSRKSVSTRDGVVSALAALVGMGSGASVGQYGPLAHLGATLGSRISRHCQVDAVIGIGCGVAAAISAAFSAPIAGIIFTHEVILRYYSLRAFAPVTVASCTSLFISRDVLDHRAVFAVNPLQNIYLPEFFAFVVVGVLGALVAVGLMQAVLLARRVSGKLPTPNWLKPAIAGLGVGMLAQWVPEILGIGKEMFRFAITPGAYDSAGLAVTLLAKIFATALCIGFGFAGGVFSPALLIGLLFGAILGNTAEYFYPEVYSGLEFYAICGMVAVTSPVIGAPLTTILIVFELTRNYELTTAVMVSVVFSNVVAYRLFGRSLFDRQLLLRGFDLSLGRDRVMLAQVGIKTLLSNEFVRVAADDSLRASRDRLVDAGQGEAYVVDDNGHYLGMLTLQRLLALERGVNLEQERAIDHADPEALRLSAEVSVWHAMEAIRDFVGESVPVTDEENRLLGVIYESTLVRAYLDGLNRLRAEENAVH